MFKIPTKIAKDLAIAVGQFYKSDPTRFDEFWSPLHISVKQDKLSLSQFIFKRIGLKNPKSKEGLTPLHFAAENGNLEMCKIIFSNTDEENPKTNTVGTVFKSALQLNPCFN